MKSPKDEGFRILIAGVPDRERCDNQISTAKYSLVSFLPVAVVEQFRRVANMYFLIIGGIMAVGYYTTAYESAISPWTTLGPLAFVISVSLLQEGLADLSRHKSDSTTNNHPCVVLTRAEDLEEENGTRDRTVMGGKDVVVNLEKSYFLGATGNQPRTPRPKGNMAQIAFESVKRMNIRQGHLVLIRNRDMVPADLILLASSSDNGNAYIETSSIDGETNLKLRTSPHLPKELLREVRRQSTRQFSETDTEEAIVRETLEQATKRICRMSALAFPGGISALENPANPIAAPEIDEEPSELGRRTSGLRLKDKAQSVAQLFGSVAKSRRSFVQREENTTKEVKYVAALRSEPPNASINTFGGVLILPPVQLGGPSVEIPLNADNMLLRGAVLRNTEWAIGISCFTGSDTKLVQNSFETPSKFSQLDRLMNRTVLVIVIIMVLCIAYCASFAVYTNSKEFDSLWYVGFSINGTEPWPYLPDLDPPQWQTTQENWFQIFFLYVTLLNNFVPLSLYVTVEIVTGALRVFINLDLDMYDPTTDTRTVARSTTVTDLGQVQYVFSDKTGTLTQNVMRFKRCSVDGLVFGAPVLKTSPDAQKALSGPAPGFHPLRKLLIGKIGIRSDSHRDVGLSGLGSVEVVEVTPSKKLTFNSEMFLRVMSICHTVVVEKDYDANQGVIDASKSVQSETDGASSNGFVTKLFGFGKKDTIKEEDHLELREMEAGMEVEEGPVTPRSESRTSEVTTTEKGKDGAPSGFAYQAESPDEGALVQAASLNFEFQVVGRDSSGIRLQCALPSLLEDDDIVDGLKNGDLSVKDIAARTASVPGVASTDNNSNTSLRLSKPRQETWEILAVNKFDSTRKRMSVLVRSPESLGNIPMLLCKGADSAMLQPHILENPTYLMTGDENAAEISQKSLISNHEDEADEWERSTLLGLQSHLGEFAKEGLRTLVLGVRVLSESECDQWLTEFKAASTAIKNRDEKLTKAAENIECKLHIVGATAIEDKLQVGVPQTIAMLGKAGIKLWVLTGDKRETAKEIGYATKVLTEKMRPGMIEVAAGPEQEVRTKMAMEFLKLVKFAKLPDYQNAAIGEDENKFFERMFFKFGKFKRRMGRAFRRFYHKYVKIIFQYCFEEIGDEDPALARIDKEEAAEDEILQLTERRRGVRRRAEEIVDAYLKSDEGRRNKKPRKSKKNHYSNEELSMNDQQPDVFSRAQSARAVLDERRSKGNFSETELRDLTVANLSSRDAGDEIFLVDEDILSMRSHLPSDGEENKKDYDSLKRTLLERLFAVDKAVRHGRLRKHLRKEKLESINERKPIPGVRIVERPQQVDADLPPGIDGPRALVIEGHALERLLGDAQLEELLFAVANTCDSVIACRVSPAQKAQLVQLVRRYVTPEPVTLAIGDGANDVGMIQEAHVGVGISGKEGQQAVNASDFAIAQFRFLQDLVLIHGRWNFMRQSTVVLFSFYKNALMAGCLIIYTSRTLFSGTPLFDQWVIAMLNFVAGVPIAALGFFDRCLDKEYIKKNPEVYTPTRRNELITKRTLIRWVLLTIAHILTLYYLTVPALASEGGGITSAFVGLMRGKDPDRPGDGEGGDLKSVGLVTFSCLILLLSYKVIYEQRSIIIGRFPSCTCREGKGEGWLNRLGYTWVANAYLSIAFYLGAIYAYQYIGRTGPSAFSPFVDTTYHVLQTRSVSWMLILFVPIAGMVLDVAAKVYSNLFYPTQTQIHVELFAKGESSGERRNSVNRTRYSTGHEVDVV